MDVGLNGEPFSELKSIAWHGTKQVLGGVLEETETPLTLMVFGSKYWSVEYYQN